jgi:hypothetical protein
LERTLNVYRDKQMIEARRQEQIQQQGWMDQRDRQKAALDYSQDVSQFRQRQMLQDQTQDAADKRMQEQARIRGDQQRDSDIIRGLREGDLELSPAAQTRIKQLEDRESQLDADPNFTGPQRDDIRQQIEKERRNIQRSAKPSTKPTMEDGVRQALGANYERYRHLPWVLGDDGVPQLPRGFQMPDENAAQEKAAKAQADRAKMVWDHAKELYKERNEATDTAKYSSWKDAYDQATKDVEVSFPGGQAAGAAPGATPGGSPTTPSAPPPIQIGPDGRAVAAPAATAVPPPAGDGWGNGSPPVSVTPTPGAVSPTAPAVGPPPPPVAPDVRNAQADNERLQREIDAKEAATASVPSVIAGAMDLPEINIAGNPVGSWQANSPWNIAAPGAASRAAVRDNLANTERYPAGTPNNRQDEADAHQARRRGMTIEQYRAARVQQSSGSSQLPPGAQWIDDNTVMLPDGRIIRRRSQ